MMFETNCSYRFMLLHVTGWEPCWSLWADCIPHGWYAVRKCWWPHLDMVKFYTLIHLFYLACIHSIRIQFDNTEQLKKHRYVLVPGNQKYDNLSWASFFACRNHGGSDGSATRSDQCWDHFELSTRIESAREDQMSEEGVLHVMQLATFQTNIIFVEWKIISGYYVYCCIMWWLKLLTVIWFNKE